MGFQSERPGLSVGPSWSRLRRIKAAVAAALALLAMVPGIVQAQLTMSAGVEHMHWEESTSPAVREDGFLFAFALGYTQRVEQGLVFAYRGKLWTGTIHYDGAALFSGQPATGKTAYFGWTNEAQLRWRQPLPGEDHRVDLVGGLGIDAWRRDLSSTQYEDYEVIFLRGGIERDAALPRTWRFKAGAKYPVWVNEDAHLTNIGFDSNPAFHPKGELSVYAELGYYLDRQWHIAGYLDGYRFGRSNEEQVTEVARGFGQMTVYQPASEMLILGIRLERMFD